MSEPTEEEPVWCWFCHKDLNPDEPTRFSREYDCYFHPHCFEKQILADAEWADGSVDRELEIFMREFRARVVEGRVVYGAEPDEPR